MTLEMLRMPYPFLELGVVTEHCFLWGLEVFRDAGAMSRAE